MSSDNLLNLPDALGVLRARAGLTQAGMTLTAAQVSRIESGKGNPTWSTIAQWLEDCDASLQDLVDLLEPSTDEQGMPTHVPSTCERTHAGLMALLEKQQVEQEKQNQRISALHKENVDLSQRAGELLQFIMVQAQVPQDVKNQLVTEYLDAIEGIGTRGDS